MSKGKLIIFSAPSGSGKSTIVGELLKEEAFKLKFSISATTREPRGKEKHAEEYYFLSMEDFNKKIEKQEFLEWEEVYSGCFYGTLKSEIERITSQGDNIVFDIDVVGGVNIKNMFKDDALAIFIQPPSIAELKNRLTKRATDSDETIQKRLDKAEFEMTFADKFDTIIINDALEDAVKETKARLTYFLKI
jgi:guanylate kinase